MFVQDKESYKYILDEFSEERITLRYITLLKQIFYCLDSLGIYDKVKINRRLLKHSVLDYFGDIYRLKKFHTHIEKVNTQKIYSYEAFWLLRRKPVQIINEIDDDELLHINEKVVTMIFLIKMLTENNINIYSFAEEGKKRFWEFAEAIYYHFRFRILTQQSLELIAESLKFGYGVYINSLIKNSSVDYNQFDLAE